MVLIHRCAGIFQRTGASTKPMTAGEMGIFHLRIKSRSHRRQTCQITSKMMWLAEKKQPSTHMTVMMGRRMFLGTESS